VRLLVDHGAYPNFGDLAMLDAMVERLAGLPGIGLEIQDASLDWRWPGARPVHYEVFAVASIIDRIGRGRRVRDRFPEGLPRLSSGWRAAAYGALSLGRTATLFPVRAAAGWRTLGAWCRNYDALLIGGGGDMNDCFPEALWRCCALIHAFAAQGKPVILSGQQLGPVASTGSRRLLLSALRRVAYVGVREPTESLRLCQEAGLTTGQFALCGDDSLGMPAADDREVQELMRSSGISPRRFIAVNLRIASYSPVRDQAILAFAETAGELATALGLELVVVPVSIDEGDSDVDAGRILADRARGVPIKVIQGANLSGRLIKGLMGHAFGAIGVSYHFNTFALSQGVPSVALYSGEYYRQKAMGLSAFWGDDRLAMSMEAIGPDAPQRVRAVFEDEALRMRLRERAVEATRDWEAMFAVNVAGRLESLSRKSS
jgi:polysaccharide pyruvyl transferase WcaK-like protein